MESAIQIRTETRAKTRAEASPGWVSTPPALSKGRRFAMGCTFLVASPLSPEAQELIPYPPPDERASLDNPQAAWGPNYTNWVSIGVGGFITDGNKAELMRRYQMPSTAFGGIENLHFERPVGTNGLFTIDGWGIFDNHNYDLRLDYTKPQVGYGRAGFREYRDWYDVHGGYFPPDSLWLTPFGQQGWIDRGNVWFEAGLRRPNVPELTFRYEHQYDSGNEDLLSWSDIDTSLGRRDIIPSLWQVDQKRDIFAFDVKHTISDTEFGGGVRYELIDIDNQTLIWRQIGMPTQRAVTQKNEEDTDLFNVHEYVTTRFDDDILLTSGYAFTLLQLDSGGSRIYGPTFDAVYDPNFRRQPFDEGFLNLDGSGSWHENEFNVSLLVTPWENVSILPAIRIAEQNESVSSSYITTSLLSGGASEYDPTQGNNNRNYLEVAESLEARYTGFTNWTFYVRGQWAEEHDLLKQQEMDLVTGDTDRLDEDVDRWTQKYSVGANWYPLYRLNMGAQYYHKIEQIDCDNRLGPPPTTYPGFLQYQSFVTDDVNFRLTLRPLSSLTLVTRYDFQLSTIDDSGNVMGLGVTKVQGGQTTSHIISESVSWSPWQRLYLQGDFSYVLDSTDSPANDLTGAAKDLVLESQNNYWNVSVLVGYALNDKTRVQLQYYYYRADNYVNNSMYSQPYGAGAEENGVTATLTRQITPSLRWSLKYGYFTNYDQTYGGNLSYNAHLIYSSLQYRF